MPRQVTQKFLKSPVTTISTLLVAVPTVLVASQTYIPLSTSGRAFCENLNELACKGTFWPLSQAADY